jgi:GT2 family glycosyltransferase
MTQEFMNRLKEVLTEQDRVILTSSGNEPNVGEIVWNYPPHWEYKLVFDNKGFSHAMNIGLVEALKTDTEYICILGNDGFPSKDMFDLLIETQTSVGSWITCPVPSRPNISVYSHLKKRNINKEVVEYFMFPAICWLMPKEVVEEVGLFDEQFGIGTYEDNDYATRTINLGGNIVVDLRANLDHRLSQTMGKFNVSKIMAENLEKFKRKHGLK